MRFKIILPFSPRSTIKVFWVELYMRFHAPIHAVCPAITSSCFDHSNNIWWSVQIPKFLYVAFEFSHVLPFQIFSLVSRSTTFLARGTLFYVLKKSVFHSSTCGKRTWTNTLHETKLVVSKSCTKKQFWISPFCARKSSWTLWGLQYTWNVWNIKIIFHSLRHREQCHRL